MFLPEVDPPEEAAVELVGFELRFPGPAGLRVVAPAHLLFQDDLVLAVAVEVADRGVVRGMAGEGLEGDGDVGPCRGVGRQAERCAGLPFPAVLHRPDEIGEGFLREFAPRVDEIRRVPERLGVQLHGRGTAGRAVDVEGDVVGIGSQQAPSHEHLAAVLRDRHHPSAQRLHLPLGESRRREDTEDQDPGGRHHLDSRALSSSIAFPCSIVIERSAGAAHWSVGCGPLGVSRQPLEDPGAVAEALGGGAHAVEHRQPEVVDRRLAAGSGCAGRS